MFVGERGVGEEDRGERGMIWMWDIKYRLEL